MWAAAFCCLLWPQVKGSAGCVGVDNGGSCGVTGRSLLQVRGLAVEVDATEEPAPNKLLAHWRFDEGWGSRIVRDDSSNGHDLPLTRHYYRNPFPEVLPGEGLQGGAVRFYMRSFAERQLPPFKGISFWMKRDPGCCGRINPFVEVQRQGGEGEQQLLRLYGGRNIEARVWNTKGTMARPSHPLGDAAGWQHVAISWEPEEAVIYLDGVRKSQSITAVAAQQNLSIRLGVHAQHPFLGLIDEVRVYEEPLSADLVRSLQSSRGRLLASETPLLADAGPALSLWLPERRAPLAGRCQGPEGTVASWQASPAGPEVRGNELRLPAVPGHWLLTLSCRAPGGTVRTASTRASLFPAHEKAGGSTLRTEATPIAGFEAAGRPVRPVGLWLFDGDAADAAGGPAAEALGGGGAMEFVEEGRHGGALRLRCAPGNCPQLSLGRPEEAKEWQGLSVAFWFKTSRKGWSQLFQKGHYFNLRSDLGDGQWHHMVRVEDEKLLRTYLDGRATRTQGYGRRPDARDLMTFGVRNGATHHGFDGLVDDLAIFDFALSFDEVEKVYKEGASSLVQRLSGNPYWTGGYSAATVAKYFPEMPLHPDFRGLFRKPDAPPPAAYVHPRLFFTPEELPALRRRLREVDAARVGMENMRAVIAEMVRGYDYPEKNLTFRGMGKESQHLGQTMAAEAFRCLIEADVEGAQRLGQQLHSLAEEVIAKWRGKPAGGQFQTRGHNSVMRVAMAFIYDFLYPYLAAETREKTRWALSLATAESWAIGMDAVQGMSSGNSNWLPWVTGDLILNLLAIEGEEGCDAGVLDRAVGAYKLWVNTGNSAWSGASYEGGGKNALTGTKMLALAQHGRPEVIASQGARRHVRQYLLHTMQPNGYWFEDELWGGMEQKAEHGDVCALRFAYPSDAVLDYLCRQALWSFLPYSRLQPHRPNVYNYNNHLLDVIFQIPSDGPADLDEHARQALADEPLSYVAKDRGLMVARSAWGQRNATWLLHNIRSLKGGHSAGNRGHFALYALGQVWAGYPNNNKNTLSNVHSIVLVDGQGQSTAPAKFLEFADAPEATWSSCDLRWPYSHGAWSGESLNSFFLEKGPWPWQELPRNQLTHWYNGIHPGNQPSGTPEGFLMAFRTVGLVRSGALPYVLVLDDLQKDEEEHSYAWRMGLPYVRKDWDVQRGTRRNQRVGYPGVTAQGSDILIPALEGKARLLARLLPGSSPAEEVRVVPQPIPRFGIPAQMLEIRARVPKARFRVLLVPLPEGAEPPATSWDEATGTLTVGQDELRLEVLASGLTRVAELKVAGRAVGKTRQCREGQCDF